MNVTTTLPPRTPMPLPEEVAMARSIRNMYIWVLVGIGLPGNLACLVTVLSMHVTTATFYVALLAAVDSVALLLKLVFHQLVSHGKLTAGACVLINSLPPFFSCYANWVLALICFERFFAVCFPLKKQVYFTKSRVYISVIILTIAMLACYGPTPFLYTDPNRKRTSCLERKSLQEFRLQFYDTFISTLYFFLPFLLIAVFTTLIIVGLYRHRRARERMGIVSTAGGSDGGVERSISIMLLSAGLVFLLLTLPACMYHLFLHKSYDLTNIEERAKAFLWYQVITLLSDANHAVNFIIYFLSAAKFRKRFMELVKSCPCFAQCCKLPSSADDDSHLTQVSHTMGTKSSSGTTTSAR